jgi:uncharacterized protein YacL
MKKLWFILMILLLSQNIVLGAPIPEPDPDAPGGGSIHTIPCQVIKAVFDAVGAVGGSLILIMFAYGCVKYIYGADDPGARKNAKQMIIHSIIGGLIMGLLLAVMTATGALAYLAECGINLT